MIVTPVINVISQRSLKSLWNWVKKSLEVFEFVSLWDYKTCDIKVTYILPNFHDGHNFSCHLLFALETTFFHQGIQGDPGLAGPEGGVGERVTDNFSYFILIMFKFFR